MMPDIIEGQWYRARLVRSSLTSRVEGEVEGHAFHFTARYGKWELGVSKQKLSEIQKADVFSYFVPPPSHPIAHAQGEDILEKHVYEGFCSEFSWQVVFNALEQFRSDPMRRNHGTY